MAKKEKEKVAEDLTPEKDPKGGISSATAVNATLANSKTIASPTLRTPVAPKAPTKR